MNPPNDMMRLKGHLLLDGLANLYEGSWSMLKELTEEAVSDTFASLCAVQSASAFDALCVLCSVRLSKGRPSEAPIAKTRFDPG